MKRRFFLASSAAIFFAAWNAPIATAQLPSPIPQPQLSPYLYLQRGGQQGYLNYRQALDQQQLAAPYTPPTPQAGAYNRVTNFQASPQTTGIASGTTPTGHADVRGPTFTFMNYSHFYTTIRPPPARPY